MAETHPRRSPLAAMADRLAALGPATGGAVTLTEEPLLTQLDLRLDAKGRAAGDVGLALGVALPVEPGTSAATGSTCVLWLGPDEWLVLAPPGSTAGIEARLRAAAGEEPVAVVDVSAQCTTLRLSGSMARAVLARGCALDLHPRAFGAGRCAQTMLARAGVVLVCLAADPPAPVYRVLVRSSFAGYLADWLLDAATEYTGGSGRRT